jgi:hypothetical protein
VLRAADNTMRSRVVDQGSKRSQHPLARRHTALRVVLLWMGIGRRKVHTRLPATTLR